MADIDKRMNELAEWAREASERVHAAAHATKEKLQSQVSTARVAADEKNDELAAQAAGAREEAKLRWSAARQSWREHIAEIRSKLDEEKAERDVHRAEHRAERAEDYAEAAVEFAFLALQEAEYAVLDATLARAEAEDLVAARS
jgi:hypothetical protein